MKNLFKSILLIIIVISFILSATILRASEVTSTSSSINSDTCPQISNNQNIKPINKNIEKAMNIVQTNIEWLEAIINELTKATLYYEVRNKIGSLGIKLLKHNDFLRKIKKISDIIIKNSQAISLPVKFDETKQTIDSLDKDLKEIFKEIRNSGNSDTNIEELASKLSSIDNKLTSQLNVISKSIKNTILTEYDKFPHKDMAEIDSLLNEDRYNIVQRVINFDNSNMNDLERNMLTFNISSFCSEFVKDLNNWYQIRNSLRSNKIDRAIIYLSYLSTYSENELNELRKNKILNNKDGNLSRRGLSFILINAETQYNDSKKSLKLLSSTYKNKEKLRKLKTTFNFVEQRLPKNNKPNIKNHELNILAPQRDSELKDYHKFKRIKLDARNIKNMNMTDGSPIFDAFMHSITKHHKDLFFNVNPIQFKTHMMKVSTKDNYDLLFFAGSDNRKIFEAAIELFNDYKKKQSSSNKKSLDEISKELGLLDSDLTQTIKKKKKKNVAQTSATQGPQNTSLVSKTMPIPGKLSSANSLPQDTELKQNEFTSTEIKRPKTTSPKWDNKLRIGENRDGNSPNEKVSLREISNLMLNNRSSFRKGHKQKNNDRPKSSSPKIIKRKNNTKKINQEASGLLEDLTAGNFKPFNGQKWANIENTIKKFIKFLNTAIPEAKHNYEYLAKGSIAKLEINDFSFLLHASHGSNPVCYPDQITYLRKGIIRSQIIEKLAEKGFDISGDILRKYKELYKEYSGFN